MAICGGLNVINFRLMCYYCNSLYGTDPIGGVLDKGLMKAYLVWISTRVISDCARPHADSTIILVSIPFFDLV